MEVEGYRGTVEDLKRESSSLLKGGHFDADSIKERQVSVTVVIADPN